MIDNKTDTGTELDVAIHLQAIHRRYDDLVAVKLLDLEILDGEFFSLIGPSGCGKTTTLKIIAGLETPTTGRVFVHGRDVTDDPPYKRPVNTVFQNYALFPHLTVEQNIAFGLVERKAKKTKIRERVGDMLDLVQLNGRENHKPSQLSGGQQQRVALARALVLEPDVLLLDEPLGALDLRLRREMQILIKQVQHEVGITFVYVTHDQEEAFSMSSRVGVMNQGVLEQVGRPRAVYQRPASAFVADFVGASNHLPAVVERVVNSDTYILALLGSSGTVECGGTPGLDLGDSARVVLRSESISIGANDGDVVVEATVVDASYSGPHTIYTMKTGDRLLKVATEGQAELRDIGDSVSLGWAASDAWVVGTNSTSADDEEEQIQLIPSGG